MEKVFIKALPVLRILIEAGHQAYFVGGAVRDSYIFMVYLQPAPCEISIRARCADQFVAGGIADASKSIGSLEIDRRKP